MTNAPGEQSWPITASVFIIMYKTPKNAATAKAAKNYFDWVFANGDAPGEEARLRAAAGAAGRAGQAVLDRQLQVLTAACAAPRAPRGARGRFSAPTTSTDPRAAMSSPQAATE
jgi:hypothetical protein